MISIIIPVYNRQDMTYECIQTIRENTGDCEIIIVDNGSSPPFKAPFTGFIDCTVLRNEENKGFPVAVNQGIRAAKGDVIILLNNDVIVTPGWAFGLIKWLADIPALMELDQSGEIIRNIPGSLGFSIVGPLTNYCAGLQRITLPTYESIEELNERVRELAEENEGIIQEVNFIIGFCMVFKKSLFDEIGPFDESLWPCSGEEIDFCFRAREAGHRIGIAQDVYLHHFGSQTFQDMQNSGEVDYTATVDRNDAHLAKRWGDDFWMRQAVEG